MSFLNIKFYKKGISEIDKFFSQTEDKSKGPIKLSGILVFGSKVERFKNFKVNIPPNYEGQI